VLQIEEEIGGIFDFMNHVYGLFGFDFELKLSTRPENYLGEIATWDFAETVCLLSRSLRPLSDARARSHSRTRSRRTIPGNGR
jgi:threonyl-tRNA synthetase